MSTILLATGFIFFTVIFKAKVWRIVSRLYKTVQESTCNYLESHIDGGAIIMIKYSKTIKYYDATDAKKWNHVMN